MSRGKGIPKTGGRQKGTPNRATAAKAEEIAASGLTPLEFMLGVMRNDEQPFPVRLDAAKSAAPYVHPKLAAIEHSGKLEVELTEAEVDADIARLQAEIAGTASEEEEDTGSGGETDAPTVVPGDDGAES